MYKIIALFGESGAGKDTILNELLMSYPKVHKIVPFTTRPPREYELDGIDYHFITKKKFLEKIAKRDFAEYTFFNNWYYGTGVDDLQEDNINIGVFNIQGITSLIQDKRCEVCPFRVYAPEKTRLIRSLAREEEPDCEEVFRRFLADKKDFISIPFEYTFLDNKDKISYCLPYIIKQIEDVVGSLPIEDITESFD